MSIYTYMAKYYDQWMDQRAYDQWIKWIFEQLQQSAMSGVKVLELCSGTGRVTLPLARKGYSVWAVDQSEEMLAVAQQKSENLLNRIKWICCDMLELNLRERFDAVLCINDGVNYMADKAELKKFMAMCHKHLKPRGILLFDISSPYKLKHILGNHTFSEAHTDSAFIWDNHYQDEEEVLEFDFHIFEKQQNGLYKRYTEQHKQVSFSREVLLEAAKGYFTIVSSVGDDLESEGDYDLRYYYVMRKDIE